MAVVKPLSMIAITAWRGYAVSIRACPASFRSIRPRGPTALKRSTQARTICQVTPPNCTASMKEVLHRTVSA